MSTLRRSLLGTVVCGVVIARQVPNLHHAAWAHALVLVAALVLAPMLLDLMRDEADDASTRGWWRILTLAQFPAALLLVAAYLQASSAVSAMAAAPWAGWLAGLAAIGCRRLMRRGFGTAAEACRDCGMIYSAVAAAWVIVDRLGMRPLGFDPAVVMLTAVHFHFAGLILPVIAGEALAQGELRFPAGLIAGCVIGGVPAVALGITATQLGAGTQLELVAAWVMAVGGVAVAVLHGRLALQPGWPAGVRWLWAAGALFLVAGMSLAALYGSRTVWLPLPWLDLPWMRALHGTANALGFGGCSVVAWWLVRQRRTSVESRP